MDEEVNACLVLCPQDPRREGGVAGGSVPDDQGAVPKKVFPPRGPRDPQAPGLGNRSQAAPPPQVGDHLQVHGMRAAILNDEEEAQLSSLRDRKSGTLRIILMACN